MYVCTSSFGIEVASPMINEPHFCFGCPSKSEMGVNPVKALDII